MKSHSDRTSRILAVFLAAFSLVITQLPAQGGKPSDSEATSLPEMPKPTKEHEWLKKLAGDWTVEAEMFPDPGKPSVKSSGTETAWMLGGFWVVSQGKGEAAGMAYASVLTLGFDAERKVYIGTWVDSMTGYLWRYEGALNETGTALILHTEGPCPKVKGRMLKFKEVIEFSDDDHKKMTSHVQGEDGNWTTAVVVTATRKK